MKVYVLESSGHRGEFAKIEGVFSSDEKAARANEILDIDGTITEIELDEIRMPRQHGLTLLVEKVKL